ncbi:unnamed protein product, partial [Rotaria sp. Silwood1]
PLVHKFVRLDSTYVFYGQPSLHRWTQQWKKIKLVTNQIEPICQSLVRDPAQCEQDLTPTSILSLNNSSNPDLQQVNSSFMYSQLIKDILLEIIYGEPANPIAWGSFIVYRGQRMLDDTFIGLRNNIGGIFTFNNFLSTTDDLNVAMKFGQRSTDQDGKTSVLFEVEVDRTVITTPFASLNDISYYNEREKEILFSMHTVFRIVQVKENNDHIWKVSLKSVSNNDLQTIQLTEQIRREIGEGSAIDRLGQLMITLGELDKAEAMYQLLLDSTHNNDEKTIASIYNQLGYIKYKQGNDLEAQTFYEKVIKIQEKISPSTNLDLAATYNNMDLLCTNFNDTSKALSYHQKALAIREKKLTVNHPDLATTYNNIGLVYDQRQEYAIALPYYEKTLKIYKQILPANHPWLATTYKNIGLAQISMGERMAGLNNLQKAMDIRK